MPYKKRLNVRKHKTNYPKPNNSKILRDKTNSCDSESTISIDNVAQQLGYQKLVVPQIRDIQTLTAYTIVQPKTDGTNSKYFSKQSFPLL